MIYISKGMSLSSGQGHTKKTLRRVQCRFACMYMYLESGDVRDICSLPGKKLILPMLIEGGQTLKSIMTFQLKLSWNLKI